MKQKRKVTKDLLEKIVDGYEGVVYCHEEDGKFVHVGKGVRDLLGYDPKELKGKNCRILVHKDDHPIVEKALLNIGNKVPPYDIRLVKKGDAEGNNPIFVQLSTGLYKKEGKPDLVYGYCLPKDIKKEIRSAFAEKAYDATYIYDDSYHFIFLNDKFRELFDCAEEERKNLKIWEFFEDQKLIKSNAEKRLAGEKVVPVYATVGLRVRSKEIFDVKLSVLKVDLYGKSYAIGAARPFSEERIREKTFAELKDLNAEKISFDALFSEMLKVLCSIVRSDHASFWLLSGDEKTYVMRAAKGFKHEDFNFINASLKQLGGVEKKLEIEPIEYDTTLKNYSLPQGSMYRIKIPLYNESQKPLAVIFAYPTVKMRKEDLEAKYGFFAPQFIAIINQTMAYMKNWIFNNLYSIGGIRADGLNEFLNNIIKNIILRMLPVQACSILAIDEFDFRRRLTLKASNHEVKYRNPNVKHFEKGQGLTGTAWNDRKTLISSEVKREKKYEGVLTESISDMITGIFVPIFSTSGDTVGVIRCLNLVSSIDRDSVIPFSNFEKEILEAIARIIGYILEISLVEQRRLLMLKQLGHEFDSPAVSVRNDARFIHDHWRTLEEAKWKFKFDDIDDNCNLLLMITDRVSFMHSEPVLKFEEVRIFGDVIIRVRDSLRAQLREKNFSKYDILITDESMKAIPYLYIDRNMFLQVFYNLLVNAIKYSEKNVPKEFKVEIKAREDKPNYIVEVSDNGIGVKDEYRDKIFEDFFRTPEARVHEDVGSGLGLSIVRRLLSLHSCEIELKSHRKPTTFSITIPNKLKKKDWWR